MCKILPFLDARKTRTYILIAYSLESLILLGLLKLLTEIGSVTFALPKSDNAFSVLSLLYIILRKTLYFSGVLFTVLRAFSLFAVTL